MDELLRQFNSDKKTKDALLAFLVNHFENKIIERAMEKKDVASLADAISELKTGFSQIEEEYGIKKKSKPPQNQAR